MVAFNTPAQFYGVPKTYLDPYQDVTDDTRRSYAAAVTGLPVGEVQPDTLPSEWFGNVEHTHRAIDDAVGFANLLVELSRRVGR